MPTSIFIEQLVVEYGDTVRTARGNSLTMSLNHLTMVTRKKYLTPSSPSTLNESTFSYIKLHKHYKHTQAHVLS